MLKFAAGFGASCDAACGLGVGGLGSKSLMGSVLFSRQDSVQGCSVVLRFSVLVQVTFVSFQWFPDQLACLCAVKTDF